MTPLNIKKKTQQIVPFLLALTILYSLVYHILMFNALQKEVTEDECADAAYSGGIFPPQCFELEMFREWHKREAEDLLVPLTEVVGETDAIDTTLTGKVAVIVDEVGDTFAGKISQDLASLETTFSQLIDSPNRLDVKLEQKDKDSPMGQTKPEPIEKAAPLLDNKLESLSPWESNLEVVQEQVHQRLHAELDKLDSTQSSKSSERRHSGPKGFGDLHAEIEARHRKRAENRLRLVQEAAQRMDRLDKNLLDVVSDRKAWESTVRKGGNGANITEASQTPAPQASFMSKRLQWSLTPAESHKRKASKSKASDAAFLKASSRQTSKVSKHDVRHMDWTGKLPKVAAIAAIKGDRKHKARMMYFVDNFKLQSYEGEKELVLVYHHKDAAAAQLIHRYANDTSIKGVVAHDRSQEMFPSNPALRYAAWSSDADVIAQWDIDEYHDMDRLSLQVRAMAFANKHACVLSTTSASHSQQEEKTEELHRVSLIGERSWMKEHWHPFSSEESAVMDAFEAGEIVELDMENNDFMGSVSRIEHIFMQATTTSAVDAQVPIVEIEGTDFSRGIEDCLYYDSSKGHVSEDAAERAISESAGEDVGRKFQNLVKRRRDIIMKLQLLCFQATMEKDVGKRKFMHDHVLEMDRIRAELDKHITNTATLFEVSEVL